MSSATGLWPLAKRTRDSRLDLAFDCDKCKAFAQGSASDGAIHPSACGRASEFFGSPHALLVLVLAGFLPNEVWRMAGL
ncbi:hypothetical protein V1286_002422 [Bradyrhizobium algeriense]|uniref:Uncharacterized protein n=1 Tax=Bradyrhizobium algeriense TaxID=634784 RepID=A0ABU8B8M0_9BRAD